MEQMKLTFVNVGYGEAMLIECPAPDCMDGTFVMVIDGGSAEPEEYAGSTSGRVPFSEYLALRGIRHIDLMVTTHTHEDHLCGLLPVARRILPAAYWQTVLDNTCRPVLDPARGKTASHRKFIRALNDGAELVRLLARGGCALSAMRAGDSGELCHGLRYTVLAPSAACCTRLRERLDALYAETEEGVFIDRLTELDREMNNYSLMLRLDYGGTRILLPGDTNSRGFGGIDPAMLRADIYKVGHHGQKDGADDALMQVIGPKAVVCCASSDRRYDSAHPQMLAMIACAGAQMWFSDCPPVEGMEIPPHRALVFTIGAKGAFSAEYCPVSV